MTLLGRLNSLTSASASASVSASVSVSMSASASALPSSSNSSSSNHDAILLPGSFLFFYLLQRNLNISPEKFKNVADYHDNGTFKRKYKTGVELGKGGYGTVYSGFRISDGLPVAIKFIPRSSVTKLKKVSFFAIFCKNIFSV